MDKVSDVDDGGNLNVDVDVVIIRSEFSVASWENPNRRILTRLVIFITECNGIICLQAYNN